MGIVTILDYGSSNLRSVAKALAAVSDPRTTILVSDRAADLRRADRVVFPGQGAIGQCMDSLHRLGLAEVVAECARNRPYLGICLGLQSLMEGSEEDGGRDCIGVLPGRVVRFPGQLAGDDGARLKIPHMGWNQVRQARAHPLWNGIGDDQYFYFVHSYYVAPRLETDMAGSTEYGVRFCAAVARDNLFAVQFHPEKSQQAGLRLLRNFLDWRP